MKEFILIIFLINIASKAFGSCTAYSPCIGISNQEKEEIFQYSPKNIQEENGRDASLMHSILSPSPEISNVIKKYVGIPYVWGGETNRGIDCSAFTREVFLEKGIFLPRTSKEQFNSPMLIEVGPNNLKIWDLLFFKKHSFGPISHVAIYIGEGKMIHSSKNEGGVYISEFQNSGLWQRLFFKAKRVTNKQEIAYVENN